MRRILASLLLCWLLVAGFGASTTAAQSDRAHELIQLVNDYRASNGMPPLETNSALMVAAQRQADWQAVNHLHSHQGEGGSMPQDRATAAGYRGLVSENVASGTRGWVTTTWAVEGWAGSYGHRMTMLSNSAHVGAGVAENEDETFYVLEVGGPSPFAPEPPAGAPAEPEEAAEQPAAEPVVVVPIVLATPREDGSIVHVVQEGQTAWAIAARYGVSLEDLLAINHLGRHTVLHPGDEIIVRLGEGQPPPPASTLPTAHTVQQGETLWTIAAHYGLAVDDLRALNGLPRGAIIKPGDVLRLRVPEPTPTETLAPSATLAPTATATAAVPTLTRTHMWAAITVTVPPASPTVAPPATATLTMTPVPSPFPVSESRARNNDQMIIMAGAAAAGIGLVVFLGGLAAMVLKRR